MGIDKYRKFIELFLIRQANFCRHSYSGGRFPTRGDSQRPARNNYNSRGIAHLAQALAHAMSSKWGPGERGAEGVTNYKSYGPTKTLAMYL